MQAIRGKHTAAMDAAALACRIAGYQHTLIDLGTGDGRFVRNVAATSPGTFALGVDLCAENLREHSRRAPANALYVVESAQRLAHYLPGAATHITINFPWGDLLTGLLLTEACLPPAVFALARPGALLEVRLNGGALQTAGYTLHQGATEAACNLRKAGFELDVPGMLYAPDLRACPTTWAHRLAFGPDPRAVYLYGVKPVRG